MKNQLIKLGVLSATVLMLAGCDVINEPYGPPQSHSMHYGYPSHRAASHSMHYGPSHPDYPSVTVYDDNSYDPQSSSMHYGP